MQYLIALAEIDNSLISATRSHMQMIINIVSPRLKETQIFILGCQFFYVQENIRLADYQIRLADFLYIH